MSLNSLRNSACQTGPLHNLSSDSRMHDGMCIRMNHCELLFWSAAKSCFADNKIEGLVSESKVDLISQGSVLFFCGRQFQIAQERHVEVRFWVEHRDPICHVWNSGCRMCEAYSLQRQSYEPLSVVHGAFFL